MTPFPKIAVRRLTPAEWPTVRALRLQALADAPEAFLGDAQVEGSRSPAEWQARFQQVAWFAAASTSPGSGAVEIGLVSSLRDPDSDERYLESMWVNPGHRGLGTTRALIGAVQALARGEQKPVLRLWVLDGNHRAAEIYGHFGFAPTGNRQPAPGHPQLMETEYAVPLSADQRPATRLIEAR